MDIETYEQYDRQKVHVYLKSIADNLPSQTPGFQVPIDSIKENALFIKMNKYSMQSTLKTPYSLKQHLSNNEIKNKEFVENAFPYNKEASNNYTIMLSNLDIVDKEIIKKLSEMTLPLQHRIDNPKNLLYNIYGSQFKGISIPQLFLKNKGCWTSLHQQTLSFESINVNILGSESVWYVIQPQSNEQFFDICDKSSKNFIDNQLGLWITEDKFQLWKNKGIKISKFIQKAGDVVITKPGTIHWVRGTGKSIHYTFNRFQETRDQLIQSSQRYQKVVERIKINPELIKRDHLVTTFPWKSLLLNYYCEYDVKFKEQMRDVLKNYFETEQNQFKKRQSKTNQDLVLFEMNGISHKHCDCCCEEILLYFTTNSDQQQLCLNCGKQNSISRNYKYYLLYQKYIKDKKEIQEQGCQNKPLVVQDHQQLMESTLLSKLPPCKGNLYNKARYTSLYGKYKNQDFTSFKVPSKIKKPNTFKKEQDMFELRPYIYVGAQLQGSNCEDLSKACCLSLKTVLNNLDRIKLPHPKTIKQQQKQENVKDIQEKIFQIENILTDLKQSFLKINKSQSKRTREKQEEKEKEVRQNKRIKKKKLNQEILIQEDDSLQLKHNISKEKDNIKRQTQKKQSLQQKIKQMEIQKKRKKKEMKRRRDKSFESSLKSQRQRVQRQTQKLTQRYNQLKAQQNQERYSSSNDFQEKIINNPLQLVKIEEKHRQNQVSSINNKSLELDIEFEKAMENKDPMKIHQRNQRVRQLCLLQLKNQKPPQENQKEKEQKNIDEMIDEGQEKKENEDADDNQDDNQGENQGENSDENQDEDQIKGGDEIIFEENSNSDRIRNKHYNLRSKK